MKSSVYHKIRRLSPRWRWLSALRHRLRQVRDRPHSIACGLGVGVFASCLPLFGGQTAIGVLLAILLRGNKLCAALGTWLSNPFTYLPMFWLNYNLGLLLLPSFRAPDRLRWDSLDDMLQQMRDISIPLGVGSVVMGLLLGSITYAASLSILTLRNQRIERRRQAILEQRKRDRQESPPRSVALPSGKPPKIVEYNQ
ncbi:MAG: DUF2062 domain-containing protein [Oscillatoriales cyanobacterium]|nr:MAG: DUF2062 domain-containing protein [Oscillatoriales cyanobacterium]